MSVSMRGSERVVSNGSSKKSLKGRLALAAAVSLTASGVWSACAEAARGGNDVKGAQVIAGAAQIANKGNTTTIRAIDKTIIKYDRFNIPKNGTVKFIQPSSSSTVLNRIDGAMPSRIEGHFTANGIVFFVNPAGVMFGPTAVVDVGRLYAGAGTIGDQDFLGGVNKFSTSNGAVVNQGKISGEQVHLFGAQVINRGSIVADGGVVTMSSGKDVFIGEEGGNIMVKVEGPTGNKSAGVVNSGTVSANKGVVRMSGAGDIYSIAVNTSGMVKANDVAIDAGKGAALVSGKIDASNTSAGGVGGKVTITGDKVGLVGATVDASGAAGGGTVLVGGDVHGGGSTPTATATLVSPGSTIKADAIDSGNGGKVVVWSDKLTAFGGKISAKGGANAGDGGFVEVSGKQRLIYKGTVDVSAAHGAAGTLLLDPDSITIQAANPDIDGNGGTNDIVNFDDLNSAAGDFPGAASIITSGQLSTLLNGGNDVVLQATNFITLAASAAVTGSGTANLTLDTPTVNLSSTITLSGGGHLSGVGVNTVNLFNGGSLQNAVDVVASAGTVNVGAGTYGGANVGKSISLLGANNTKTGFDGTRGAESIINGQVVLSAPNTTFKGFTVTGVSSGAGVVASNAQGDLIANNIISDNVFGMSLASDGSADVTVSGNLFDTNARPGSASGNGIYTDFAVSNLVVTNNHFTGNTEGSVSLFNTGADPNGGTNITISNNTMTDDGPISLEGVGHVVIDGNTINNSTAHAIWIATGVDHVTIQNNLLDNNGGAGIKFDPDGGGSASNNVTIQQNSITGNDDGGIIFATSANTVDIHNNFIENNGLSGVGSGVEFKAGTSSGVTINNNTIAANQEAGIKIGTGTYDTVTPLNATSNFWGSANGPTAAGNSFNVTAQGDSIVKPGNVTVNYVRWLSDGTDQNGGTAGFQPDLGTLFAPVTLNGSFFSNIQAAHNAASTIAVDTIGLATGEYTENVSTDREVALQFSGDGTLKGSLSLGANLSVSGDGSIVIGSTVNVGNHAFVVDTQTAGGTFININGKITGSGGTVSILGQQTVTINAAIDPPATVTLSSLDDVVVNAAVSAQDLISVTAGTDGTGGLTINGGGSLTSSGGTGNVSISTGTTSGNVALGGSVTADGAVAISTAGTVNQTAGAVSAASLDIQGATSVNLPSGTNAISGAITIGTTGNATIFNDTATNLGSSSVGGNLSVTSSGNIDDSGALAVGGSATFETRSGGTANITLDQPLSTFGSVVARSRNAGNTGNGTGNISIVESGTMDVTAIVTGGGAINLEATKINLSGGNDSVESVGGTITLQPTAPGATINLGTNDPVGFSLTQAQILALKDGFSAIVIGRATGTGLVTVSANVNFTDSVSVVGGTIVGGATLGTSGNLSLQARTGSVSGGVGTSILPVDVSVGGTLAVTTNGSGSNGDIFVSSSNALSVGAISTDSGSAQTVRISGNGLTLTAANPNAVNDNYTFVSTAAFTVNNVVFTGNTTSVTATGNITDTGSGVLATTGASGLTLVSSGGGIGVNAGNALGVSVGGSGVLTLTTGGAGAAGNAFVTSAGALTLGAVNTNVADAQTVDVRTTSGNLKLNLAVSGNDNWVLNSAGNLNNGGLALTAASVDADAVTGIGTTAVFEVATPSISADSSTSGFVNINNTSAAPVTIGSLSTAGGSNVTYSQSGGGSATFNAANTAANGNVTLVNIGGNVVIAGPITAGGTGQAQVVSTSGTITGGGTVSGGTVDLQAALGIGTTGSHLPVVAATLNASTSGAAASIFIDNSSGGTMTLNDVHTSGAGSDITISQSGAGNRLRLVSVSATGDVTLSTNETINEGPTDTNPKITAVNVNLIADKGIGTTSQLDLAASGTVNVNTDTGDVSIRNASALTLGASSVGGSMTLVADAGITLSGPVDVGNVFTATASAGDITANADIGGTLAPTSISFNGVNITLANVTGGSGNQAYNASGLITLNGTDYRSSGGSISFNGPVALAVPAVSVDTTFLAAAGNNITFGSTVNGATALTLSAGVGNISIGAAAGGNTKLTSLSASGADIALHDVSTIGAQLYDGNATLAADATLSTSGGTDADDIHFTGTITGPGGLTAVAAGDGDVILDGAGGVGTALGFANLTGDEITINGMATSGPQSYTATSGNLTLSGNYTAASGAITFAAATATLGGDTSVHATGGTDADDVVFTGTVDGAHIFGAQADGSGDVLIVGDIGGSAPPTSVVVTGNDVSIKNVKTLFGQTYGATGTILLNGSNYESTLGGDITFGGDTLLTVDTTVDSAGGQITFGQALDGGHALTLNSGAGATRFLGVVGGNAPLTTLTTDSAGTTQINGGAISTSGDQIYNDAVTLGGDAVLTGVNVTFAKTVDSETATAKSLAVNASGVTTFGGDVGVTHELQSLTTDLAGSTVLGTGTAIAITTHEDQIFNDAVTLGSDVTVNGNDITFAKTVDGAFALTVNSNNTGSAGVTTFGGAVGGTTELASLTTNADGSTHINGGSVKTSGAQNYGDAVLLGSNTTLSVSGGTESDDITIGGTIDGPGSLVAIAAGSGDVTVGGAGGGTSKLLSATIIAEDITLNGMKTVGVQKYTGTGTVTMSGNYTVDGGGLVATSGGAMTLSGTYSADSGGLSFTSGGPLTLEGDFGAAGGAITFTAAAATLSGDANVHTSGGADTDDISFSGTIDGGHDLTLAAGGSGDVVISGDIGGTTALSSVGAGGNDISIKNVKTTDEQAYTASGTITLNGGTYQSTVGGDIDFAGDTVLTTATTVSTTAGKAITFEKTLNGAQTLALNTDGLTTFAGVVGGTTPLTSITTDVGGTTRINTTAVKTAADQIYNDAVTLGVDTTLTGVNVTFASTLNGAFALNVVASGDTTFGGIVGGTTKLAALTTDGPGRTLINTTAISTADAGDQIYGDTVVLGADTTLSGNDITFSKTVDGAHSLGTSTHGTGTTTFTGVVGGTTPLTSLTTDSDGTTRINGGGVTTTGDQTYKNAVVVGHDATVLAGTNISFNVTLDSDATPRDLTVNSSSNGTTTFGGSVGAATNGAFKTITTNLDGTTVIAGTVMKTTAGQTYNDPVTLKNDVTVTGTDVKFADTLNSDATARALTVNASGVTTFSKAVGQAASLKSLTTDANGSTRIDGGVVSTSTTQTYIDPVTVGLDTTFTGTNITFSSTLNSDALATPRNVTINGSGTTQFAGTVGGNFKLKNLVTDAAGTTTLNALAINTTLNQTYNDTVTVGGNTTLSGVDIAFQQTVNGAHTLTVTGSGATLFVGVVGGTSPLTSLTSNGGGTTEFRGGTVKTTGAQTLADNVKVTVDTTFTGVGVSFGGTIDSDVLTTAAGDGRSLTINSGVSGSGATLTASGDISITGAVGGVSKISTVAFTGKNVDIHSVHTTKAQTYIAKGVATLHDTYTADNGAFSMTGNTSVGSNTTVNTNGTGGGESANDITFDGTIDGNHTLALHASGTADVDVKKAIGGTTALGALDVSAQTIKLISARTKSGGGNSGDITLKVVADSPQDNRFDSDASGSAEAFKPVGVISLKGGLQSTGGDVLLGTQTPRSETDVVAFPTIVIEPPSGGTAVISGKNVTMGRNEKLVVDGSVQIKADQTAIISDITAADSIEVTAPSIKINQRVPGTVISSDGATLLHDVNTDFVAKNSINLNGDAELLDPPSGVSINPLNRVQFATVGGDVRGTPAGTSVRALLEKDFSIRLGGSPSGEFVDLRAEGASVTNPAAALAGAAPQESRQPEVENSVAGSQATELERLGIFAKPMDRDSLVGFLEGFMLYNDVPGGVASGGTVPREQYRVTRNRLSYDGARRVLDLYYIAFYKTDENGRVILDKNGERQDNTKAIREAIEASIKDYRAKTGQKTGSIDPKAFRQYVETTPSQTERDALKYMNRLRNLFNEILPVGEPGSKKGMGLTPFEAGISRTVLVQNLAVDGIEPEKLEEAILFDTSRLGRPQARPMVSPQPRPVAK